jgi:uncharacterized membrane protein
LRAQGEPLASQTFWRLRRFARKPGVRAAAFVALACATAGVGYLVRDQIPERYNDFIGASAVESLLNVLASSLLAVTTFTLGAMVSAYGSAANATPRATPLLIADTTSQKVLSTFVGAFVFAIVGLVLLRTGVYGAGGRAVLFGATAFVVVLVVIALLRWIAQLSHLGLLSDSIERVEAAAREAFEPWKRHPRLGARPPAETASGAPVPARRIGYVQHVDLGALQRLAETHALTLHLTAIPGAFVAPDDALVRVEGEADAAARDAIAAAFQIDARRTFDYDPRYGLLVLSEIASKALSPGINDPGTALDVMMRATRLIADWGGRERREHAAPLYDRLRAPELCGGDLIDDAFDAIERDGAGLVEVALRLQTSLAILAGSPDAETAAAARRHSQRGLARARAALTHADDYVRVERAAIAGREERP